MSARVACCLTVLLNPLAAAVGRRLFAFYAARFLLYHLHVPKAAGRAFEEDAAKVLRGSWLSLVSREGCYDDLPGTLGVALLLRSPRAHVTSQYMYCSRSSDLGPRLYSRAAMPRTLGAWVGNWTAMRARGEATGSFRALSVLPGDEKHNPPWALPFRCYNPIDLQTQRLTCQKVYDYPQEADVDQAIRNLRGAWFVGLTEAYQESLCLLHAKVHRRLPRECNCTGSPASIAYAFTRRSHGVRRYSLDEVPEEALEAVDGITAKDRLLYAEALRRFARELREVEAAYGVNLSCASSVLRAA